MVVVVVVFVVVVVVGEVVVGVVEVFPEGRLVKMHQFFLGVCGQWGCVMCIWDREQNCASCNLAYLGNLEWVRRREVSIRTTDGTNGGSQRPEDRKIRWER